MLISLWQNLTYPNLEVSSSHHSIPNAVIRCNNYKLQIMLHSERNCKCFYSQLCFSQRTEKQLTTRWKHLEKPYHSACQKIQILQNDDCFTKISLNSVPPKKCFTAVLPKMKDFRMFLELHGPATHLQTFSFGWINKGL